MMLFSFVIAIVAATVIIVIIIIIIVFTTTTTNTITGYVAINATAMVTSLTKTSITVIIDIITNVLAMMTALIHIHSMVFIYLHFTARWMMQWGCLAWVGDKSTIVVISRVRIIITNIVVVIIVILYIIFDTIITTINITIMIIDYITWDIIHIWPSRHQVIEIFVEPVWFCETVIVDVTIIHIKCFIGHVCMFILGVSLKCHVSRREWVTCVAVSRLILHRGRLFLRRQVYHSKLGIANVQLISFNMAKHEITIQG